jgi:endonuclease/exonuclease/phosphatase (EEP) superfamily protein YafD
MTLDCAWPHGQATGAQWPGSLRRVLVFCLLYVLVIPQSGAATESSLRVMTYNVYGMFVPERVPLAGMRSRRPDLVLLQEVRNARHVTVLSQALGLPYWRFAPYLRERGGVALLSRWPLGPAQKLFLDHSPQGKVALAARVSSPLGHFWVCSVHLDNPLSVRTPTSLWQKVLFLWQEFFTATPRTQQAQELSTWLFGLGSESMILGGDFNSMPFAGVDRHLRQYFSDALSITLQQYFTGTYWGPPHNPVLPRLDFLYYSPSWQVVDAQVIQQKASDHFPVLAVLSPALKAPDPLAPQHDPKVFAGSASRRF